MVIQETSGLEKIPSWEPAKDETVAAKVTKMLADANATLGWPLPSECMAMAINRLEGVEQDDTDRGVALLIQMGKQTPPEGMRLAIAHAKPC